MPDPVPRRDVESLEARLQRVEGRVVGLLVLVAVLTAHLATVTAALVYIATRS
jgi:hypothetical protein